MTQISMDGVFLFIGIACLALFLVNLFAASFDRDRIAEYLGKSRSRLIDKRWDPFGPGCLGGLGMRQYRITYQDRRGRVHHAHVKTSMLGGVYLSHNKVVQDVPKMTPEEEKAALRKRLEELEGE